MVMALRPEVQIGYSSEQIRDDGEIMRPVEHVSDGRTLIRIDLSTS